MYVYSRERGPAGGGSCFGVTDPSELRPPFHEMPGRTGKPERIMRWKVMQGDLVIGVVREDVPGKFSAFFISERIPINGEFMSREEAEQAVLAESANPF